MLTPRQPIPDPSAPTPKVADVQLFLGENCNSPHCPCCNNDPVIEWDYLWSLEDTIHDSSTLEETPAPRSHSTASGYQWTWTSASGTRAASIDLPEAYAIDQITRDSLAPDTQ